MLVGSVNVPDDVTYKLASAFNVGAPNVILPVDSINAPPDPAVKVIVCPLVVIEIGLAEVPMLLALALGTVKMIELLFD